MARIEFDSGQSEAREAVVASFDMCGFSDFCNHADAYAQLPKFVASLFDEVDRFFLGWLEADGSEASGKTKAPDFMKYTGDGALMIWLLPEDLGERQRRCRTVVQAMRKLRERLGDVIPRWEAEWQVRGLPRPARFGLAKGLVHPLRAKRFTLFDGEIVDYAGYCINLAVRLQNHCPEIGFIVHGPVLPDIPESCLKWTAQGMKGTRSEPVLVFAADMPAMDMGYFGSKFAPIGDDPDPRIKPFRAELANSGNPAPLGQPRFEARFVGGPMNGVRAFLPSRPAEWHPVTDVLGAGGDVIGQEVSFYTRVSEALPLVYKFVSKKPYS
jgi:class 3 adenylate cyclase